MGAPAESGRPRNRLGAGCNQGWRRLAPPPRTGAAQDEARDDQRGAKPRRRGRDYVAANENERAGQRREFVAAKAGNPMRTRKATGMASTIMSYMKR